MKLLLKKEKKIFISEIFYNIELETGKVRAHDFIILNGKSEST